MEVLVESGFQKRIQCDKIKIARNLEMVIVQHFSGNDLDPHRLLGLLEVVNVESKHQDGFLARMKQIRKASQDAKEPEPEDHPDPRMDDWFDIPTGSPKPSELVWFVITAVIVPFLLYFFYGPIGLMVGIFIFTMYNIVTYLIVRWRRKRLLKAGRPSYIEKALAPGKQQISAARERILDNAKQFTLHGIPGFRTRTLWKMILATAFYLLWICILAISFWKQSYGLALLLAVTGGLFVGGTQDELN